MAKPSESTTTSTQPQSHGRVMMKLKAQANTSTQTAFSHPAMIEDDLEGYLPSSSTKFSQPHALQHSVNVTLTNIKRHAY